MIERFKKIKEFCKNNRSYIIYLLLIILILCGGYLRVLPWESLSAGYPSSPDAFLFLRYTNYIFENDELMERDMMRYSPLGYDTSGENVFLSYMIVYMYKVASIFSNNVTLTDVFLFYPVIAFVIADLIFFFIVRRLFGDSVALISTAFMNVIPSIFFTRTLVGVSDKEPAGLVFMFLAIYFYLVGLDKIGKKNKIIYGALAGLSTGLMALVWGGVQFLIVLLSGFVLIEVFLDRFKDDDFFLFMSLVILALPIMILFTGKYTLITLIQDVAVILMLGAGFVLIFKKLVDKFLKGELRERIAAKIPLPLFVFVCAGISGIVGGSIILGPMFIFDRISAISSNILEPAGTSKFILTVEESVKPYIRIWLDQFGIFFYAFILGSVILFYNIIKDIESSNLKKSYKVGSNNEVKSEFGVRSKILVTLSFLMLVLGILYNRRALNSILNGENLISKSLYLGSIMFFSGVILAIYLYSYYKNKSLYHNLKCIESKYIFFILWFILVLIGAQGSIRLIFLVTPVSAVLGSYLIVEIYNKSRLAKDKLYKICYLIIILLLFIAPSSAFSLNTFGSLWSLTKKSYNFASITIPSYDPQWLQAETWVRENTPENSVFSHWWDYGYFVQTGFNRATVLDGGNAIGYWNHLIARLVITGNDEEKALEFLKTHKANYLLYVVEDLLKIKPISSLASGNELDRLSFATLFGTIPEQIKHTEKGYEYLFGPNKEIKLEEDLNFKGKLFIKENYLITGLKLNVDISPSGQFVLGQPNIILQYFGNFVEVPISCMYMDGKKIDYPNYGIDACFYIIPYISGDGNADLLKVGFYLPKKLKNNLFARLYLFDEKIEGFKLVYSDEQNQERNYKVFLYAPTSKLAGPLKIWELDYPANIKENPEYLNTSYPENIPY